MDFDCYGIEEWAASRPGQLARGYASAQADAATLAFWYRTARAWLARRIGLNRRKKENHTRLSRAGT